MEIFIFIVDIVKHNDDALVCLFDFPPKVEELATSGFD